MADYDNRDELKKMLERYLAGEASPAEIRLLESWDALLDGRLNAFEQLSPVEKESVRAEMEAKLRESLAPARRPLFRTGWMSYAGIAAALMMAVMLAVYFRMGKRALPEADVAPVERVLPGGNKATLTLADGTKINLDSSKAGIRVSNERMNYNDGTAIGASTRQQASVAENASSVTYNMLTTPKGGQYQILLPDGTKVWLNAASTLRYPSEFAAGRREVQLEGEAYFEVARDRKNTGDQFVVRSHGQSITVLATEFNVAAYASDPAILTTLVSGKVQVRAEEGGMQTLSPGEQAVKGPAALYKRLADVGTATAWKEGIFYFNDTPLQEMLSQIARWYDITVRYNGKVPDEQFSGKMSRKVELQAVLGFLKNSGIDYTLKGRELIIQ